MKKLLASILVLVMALVLTIPAMADSPSAPEAQTITLEPNVTLSSPGYVSVSVTGPGAIDLDIGLSDEGYLEMESVTTGDFRITNNSIAGIGEDNTFDGSISVSLGISGVDSSVFITSWNNSWGGTSTTIAAGGSATTKLVYSLAGDTLARTTEVTGKANATVTFTITLGQ